MTYELRREIFIRSPRGVVFDFFSRAQNLAAITPPSMHFRLLTPEPIAMAAGTELRYSLRVHGFPVRWKTAIEAWNPPSAFSDAQAEGPYKLWRHVHRFREAEGGTWMEDFVNYALPFGPLGRMAHWLVIRRDLEAIFNYRTERIQVLFGS